MILRKAIYTEIRRLRSEIVALEERIAGKENEIRLLQSECSHDNGYHFGRSCSICDKENLEGEKDDTT